MDIELKCMMDSPKGKLRATYQEVSDLITSQSKNDIQTNNSRPRRFSRKKATSAPSIIAEWNTLSVSEVANLSASTRQLSTAEQATTAPARNSTMFNMSSNSKNTLGATSFDTMLYGQSPQTVVGKSFNILGTKNSTSNKFKPKDLTLA